MAREPINSFAARIARNGEIKEFVSSFLEHNGSLSDLRAAIYETHPSSHSKGSRLSQAIEDAAIGGIFRTRRACADAAGNTIIGD